MESTEICALIYAFFDNATIAAGLSVGVGAWIATSQYKRQKKLELFSTQKKEVIDLLSQLLQSIEEFVFIYDRIVRSLSLVRTSKQPAEIKTMEDRRKSREHWQYYIDSLKVIEEVEMPRLSDLFNEKIPLTDKKLSGLIKLSFSKHDPVQENYKLLRTDLQRWHGFIAKNIGNTPLDFQRATESITETSTKKINSLIETLSNTIIEA